MGMGFAPTWIRQVTPPPASQNHFNQWQWVTQNNAMVVLNCAFAKDFSASIINRLYEENYVYI